MTNASSPQPPTPHESAPVSLPDQQSVPESLDQLLDEAQNFHEASLAVSRYVHQWVLRNGPSARELADVLHGKWLGHPLHPLLTDLTVGAWTWGFYFDLMARLTGSRQTQHLADRLIWLGTLSALPTAIAGLADFSAIKRSAASYGGAHALLNSVAWLCFLESSRARLAKNQSRAFFLALGGMLVSSLSAWLGGDLVYRHRIGVNHAPAANLTDWTVALPLDDLSEATLTPVEVGGESLVLFRHGQKVVAISGVCSHAGGPLGDGQRIDEWCVECPWHQSVFDLRDGHVVHGPAVYAQPHYLTRIRDGQIEVRAAGPGA
ncbi:MAG: Rieske 2Fe-2S domain-containing protein [Anaerolineae bacterium]|nr:Rieske 2Fe-2S domain-containing protein [Anaerolineae bacterium]